MALVKTVEMRVLAKAGDAQAKLDEIAAKGDKLQSDGIKMRFRIDDGDAKGQLDAIKAKADALGFKDVSINVKVDSKGRAVADLAAIKAEADRLGGRSSVYAGAGGGGISALLGGASSAASGLPLVGGVAGSGPLGLGAVAAGLAALLPEVVAVGSGFAAAGAGAGAFAALALPAVEKVKKALSDISKGKPLAGLHLTSDESGAVKGIRQLETEFGKLSKAFQPTAFKVFNDALRVANSLLPHLAQFATPFANALDGLLRKLGQFTQSAGFNQWIKQFSSLIGPAVSAIGTGIGQVAIQFGKLLTIFSGKDVAHGINIAFGGIKAAIQGIIAVVGGLKRAWDSISQTPTIKRLANDFKQAWDAITATGKKKPDFSALTSAVKDAVNTAVTWLSSKLGPLINGALKTASSWLSANAGTILVPAGKALMQGLLDGISAKIPSLLGLLAKVATTIAEHKGPIEKDRVLLVPHGQAIMGGLILGMESQLPALKKTAEKAAKIISDRIKAEMSLAKGVSSATLSGLGLTSIDLSQTTVAGGMQSYLASIKAFITEIKQLTSMHLNKGILQQLIQAGPVTGGQYAQNILQGGVGPVNALYKQIQQQSALLGAQAAMSMYGGKVAPKGDTYTISVQAGLVTDKQALALEIVKILRAYKRHNGGASLGLG